MPKSLAESQYHRHYNSEIPYRKKTIHIYIFFSPRHTFNCPSSSGRVRCLDGIESCLLRVLALHFGTADWIMTQHSRTVSTIVGFLLLLACTSFQRRNQTPVKRKKNPSLSEVEPIASRPSRLSLYHTTGAQLSWQAQDNLRIHDLDEEQENSAGGSKAVRDSALILKKVSASSPQKTRRISAHTGSLPVTGLLEKTWHGA